MTKGELNRRISVWRKPLIDDGTASVEGAPVEIGKRWAKMVDISDGERLRAEQHGQELATRFTVLSDSLTRTSTGKDLLKCEGASYYVIGTKRLGARRRDAI
ncbi:MAG: phage head-tail adapter protein, partial [Sphingomonadales bacterium 39-62-4]